MQGKHMIYDSLLHCSLEPIIIKISSLSDSDCCTWTENQEM